MAVSRTLRWALRVAGPACLVIGVYGFATNTTMPPVRDPIDVVNGFRDVAVRLAVAFLLVACGGLMTYYGYVGAATRYVAAETRPAIAIAAGAVSEGLAGVSCPACGATAAAGHPRCDRCGAALGR